MRTDRSLNRRERVENVRFSFMPFQSIRLHKCFVYKLRYKQEYATLVIRDFESKMRSSASIHLRFNTRICVTRISQWWRVEKRATAGQDERHKHVLFTIRTSIPYICVLPVGRPICRLIKRSGPTARLCSVSKFTIYSLYIDIDWQTMFFLFRLNDDRTRNDDDNP